MEASVQNSLFLVMFSCLPFGLATAQNVSVEYDIDPYLEYRPAFASSLPVQILLTGVVLTLVAVLFIHLIFTAQYHWPLAPVNYVLQLSGVTTLLISLIATLHVVLSATLAESEKWPYMLSYIAVNVPPFDTGPGVDTDGWSVAEQATWLVMNASTSGLIQITHIQFLTLLYPSRLEGRLIFTLLGPLAIVAAVMQLLPIHGSADVTYVSSAVKNVCNATLSLLFTAALFIWGFLVNRKQAWRTDGGTAAFGCAALTLAVVSTVLNFLYVPREEEYAWLPSLMWAVVLWQSFLGWWWWVGAGSGSGLVSEEDLNEKVKKEAKRESRRKQARERRRETKQKAKMAWNGVAGAFTYRDGPQQSSSPDPSSEVDSNSNDHPATGSPTDSSKSKPTSSVFSTSTTTTYATLPRLLPAIVHRWYASLRHAHLTATRQQDIERIERIREMDRCGAIDAGRQGWGLGSFGWRVGPNVPQDSAREFELYDSSEWATRRRENMEPHTRAEDSDEEPSRSPDTPTRPPLAAQPTPRRPPPRSVWWWGPLARWRLQDSTVYQ